MEPRRCVILIQEVWAISAKTELMYRLTSGVLSYSLDLDVLRSHGRLQSSLQVESMDTVINHR